MAASKTRGLGAPLPDAAPANWVDRGAPAALRPWLRLARLDRPAGIWLLMLPGWQGIALADAVARRGPDLRLLAVFALGAVLMRACGCAVNDIIDRRMDARVARTAGRPVASGQIGPGAAAAFALACALAAGVLALALNLASLALAVGSLPLVALYPFMKRITWWPQAWLGLTFNWGALTGFAAAAGAAGLEQHWPLALALYGSGVFWTLGYDTIYAMLDVADDLAAGVKSSALRLEGRAPAFVALAYGVSLALAALAVAAARLGALAWAGLLLLAGHFAWQVARLRRAEAPILAIFQSNTGAGVVLFAALALGAWRP